jgi:heme A synthase
MADLLKLVWEVFVLADSIRKGEMTKGAWIGAGVFLLAIAGIGVPTVIYYNRHPDASAHVAIDAAVLLALVLIVYFLFAIRWRRSLRRQAPAQDQPTIQN